MNVQTQPTISEVLIGSKQLPGTLTVPNRPIGTVVFAHGSGSSRFSPRNQFVARQLQNSRLATLLFDLLSEEESQDRRNVFDIQFLAERLAEGVDWAAQQQAKADPRIGLFGASTGAAAALVTAACQAESVAAVVSRGGRPDLASQYLSRVKSPTLLIVGGDDTVVIDMNQTALDLLRCEARMEIIPGATHLFPEPGTLEQVAGLASEWFQTHLSKERDAS